MATELCIMECVCASQESVPISELQAPILAFARDQCIYVLSGVQKSVPVPEFQASILAFARDPLHLRDFQVF